MPGAQIDGWSEYRRLVMQELERLGGELNGLKAELGRAHTEIATLKVKAGFWGAVAGAIPALGAALLWYLAQ